MRRLTCFILLAVLTSTAPVQAEAPRSLATALQDPARPAEDRARDADRKPEAVMAFLGVSEGDTVVDLIAASGYFTEVMAHAVGPTGTVYAQNGEYVLKMREGANDKAMTARLANDRLPNVKRLDREVRDLGLAPNSVDAAITALNFHDVYNGQGPEAAAGFLGVAMAFLKPGGALGIIDHVGVAGADNTALHRIEKSIAIEMATKAGFTVTESDALRNPADDHTLGVFDPAIRGKTDQFFLKLTKPE